MFLQPIEEPTSLKLRVAWWWSKWKFGKVMTPVKVVYARAPAALGISQAISAFLQRGYRLDKGLGFLLTHYVALQNRCSFCADIGEALARPGAALREKMAAVEGFDTAVCFSAREKAALAFAREWLETRYAGGPARDALRAHFSDQEIVEIVLICACENYYNSINHALGIESDGLCAVAQQKA